jgi:hypothetical protein
VNKVNRVTPGGVKELAGHFGYTPIISNGIRILNIEEHHVHLLYFILDQSS